ncbi:MAG: F0F1 ATP synthase subunit epsilon, partial [Candidatus Sumerlaeales bacterium]|nr:F0F1 ATP synthase subunit epsilon [Candidatus Sumerlaeales bacterium]
TTVTLPSTNGYFGVLAHHAPLVSILGKGLITIQQSGKSGYLQAELSGGFAETSNNTMTILADSMTELKSVQPSKN